MLIPPSNSQRAFSLLLLAASLSASAQMPLPPPGPLDPARIAELRPPTPSHETAEFIWTANDAAARNPALQASVRGQDDKAAPHFFRAHFHLDTLPPDATLYLAGPRSAAVFLNGREVLRLADDPARPKNLSVLTAPVAPALHPGDNVLALSVIRGHSSLHTGASPTINQVTYGEVLALKIVPATLAIDAPPLLVSNTQWRSTLNPAPDWQQPASDDRVWPLVDSLGILGSQTDFLQWNADAGLYAWPGYTGITPTLRVFDLAPVHTSPLPPAATKNENSVLLDFGRELSARLRLSSTAATTTQVIASYGESREEALKDKSYLGPRTLTVPPHATAFGPKSGFRFVKLTLPPGLSLDQLNPAAEAITFPVDYLGSFESSDPELNRIWETAAYTARLCMQEGIWDGIKRDRGRWMGDLDVTGRTITSVFASPETNGLMQRTMADIIGDPPVTRDINTIAGYSALWITGEANFFRHTGDLAYLRRMHQPLLGLLRVMDAELDPASSLFTNPAHHKVFVDWSDGFNTDTPEARAATHLEFALAYTEAAWLLNQLGDSGNATLYRQAALRLQAAAQAHLLTPETHTFGTRWQTNAMAVVSGVATPPEREAIWQQVLSHLRDAPAPGHPALVITPFYGYYVLSALATLDRRPEALAWISTYWGGMLSEGASSFWESYDPHWPRQDFHAFLEADNKRGYYISLAHGWSSGPAAWLLEQILGIQPTGPGFHEVTLRPDLAGLAFARGAEPTPRGPLQIDLQPKILKITLPSGTRATVQLPFPPNAASITLNNHPLPPTTLEANRLQLILDQPGAYTFTSH